MFLQANLITYFNMGNTRMTVKHRNSLSTIQLLIEFEDINWNRRLEALDQFFFFFLDEKL